MKANELRIGNHVLHPINNSIVVITRDMFTIESGLTNLEDYRPIPFSEEWLLKFGFIKNDWYNGKHFVLNKYCSIIIEKSGCDKGVWYLGDKSDAYCHRLKKIQFIHELQNLYFALESEELTIK